MPASWRDYAFDFSREEASFSAFRGAREQWRNPHREAPTLRNRQGMWALIGETGMVLRRGQELAGVLAPVERRLMKAGRGQKGEDSLVKGH